MIHRPRRLRSTEAMRTLVADLDLTPRALMWPLFVREGLDAPRDIAGMPGVVQHTLESLLDALDEAIEAGIRSVMLFAVPEERDAIGSQADAPDGILARTVRAARSHVGDRLVLVADLCLDEFTDHGHCGVLDSAGRVDNDATLTRYASMACTLAAAGADLVGTSGAMDGQVAAVRASLDEHGFTDTGILAYAAKYASSFYGPFREAVESRLDGDRLTYQHSYLRRREGREEVLLDLEQGADMVMVKPALAYLDVVAAAAEVSPRPVVAYVVSGEYAMVEAAAAAGVLDREPAVLEILFGLRRAGANIICTYWALEFARILGGRR